MNNLDLVFTSFKNTEPPYIQNEEYQSIKNMYDWFSQPNSNWSDIDFSWPTTKVQQEDIFVDEPQNWFFQNKVVPQQLRTQQNKVVPQKTSQKKQQINITTSRGYTSFIQAMNRYEQHSGEKMDETKRRFLSNFAYLESTYNPKASARGSSAKGYFGIIRAGRKDLGSDQEYLNDTNLQFKAASRLYNYNKSHYKEVFTKGRKLGLTEFQIMYGLWFYPKGMINYVNNGGKDDGFKDSMGTSLTAVLNKAKRLP